MQARNRALFGCFEAIYVTRVEKLDFEAEIERPSAGQTWLWRIRSSSESWLRWQIVALNADPKAVGVGALRLGTVGRCCEK